MTQKLFDTPTLKLRNNRILLAFVFLKYEILKREFCKFCYFSDICEYTMVEKVYI
jgi:hypothetical protein